MNLITGIAAMITFSRYRSCFNNILFFREALVKKMNSLKVKVESKKLIKGQQIEKRLNDKDINAMKIEQIIQNINLIIQKILKDKLIIGRHE